MHQEPKAWIYCRIDAPEDVHGMLKVQRKQLMDYAEQMGFQVKGSSTDLAAGNSDILRMGILFENRPLAAGGSFTGT